jgi:RNA polymerase sigma-70 factor (ECF subfamily)
MAETADDEALVARFNRGDESVFEQIVQKYSANVAGLVNRLLGWPGEVDDITQDVFVAAYLGLKNFRGECSLKTWLFTITVNKCRSYKYRRLLRLRVFSKVGNKVYHARHRAADKTPMDSETFDRVRRAVVALPAKYREPVVLRYLQELSTNDICRVLGISRNLLQVRLNRAKKRLRQELVDLMEQ